MNNSFLKIFLIAFVIALPFSIASGLIGVPAISFLLGWIAGTIVWVVLDWN